MTNGEFPKTLILSDAGLPSVVACVAAREAAIGAGCDAGAIADRVVAAPFALSTQSALLQRRAVVAQAEATGVGALKETPPLASVNAHASADEREGIELLGALLAAAHAGFRRVVWPASAGAGESVDIDRLSQIADRALCAARYASVCAADDGAGVELETPYAELSDRQLAELALDMGCPVDTCWWALASGGQDDPVKAERQRWQRAFEIVGWTISAA
ncbi:MAG TPA: hypothetical protein VD971_08290 [Phycisphaerales bacterium]|nr:hypothetical protein [Phycisphaerales bacterium]